MGNTINEELPCLVCGYNLRGNQSGLCPECGQPVDVKASRASLHSSSITGRKLFWLSLIGPFIAQLAWLPVLLGYSFITAIVVGMISRSLNLTAIAVFGGVIVFLLVLHGLVIAALCDDYLRIKALQGKEVTKTQRALLIAALLCADAAVYVVIIGGIVLRTQNT